MDCAERVCSPPGNGGAGPGGWQPFFTSGGQLARLVVMHTELMQALSMRLDRLPIAEPKTSLTSQTEKPTAKAQNGKQRRGAFCNKSLPKKAPPNNLY